MREIKGGVGGEFDRSWITFLEKRWSACSIPGLCELWPQGCWALTALLDGFQFRAGQCPAGEEHGQKISRLPVKRRGDALHKLLALHHSPLFKQENLIISREWRRSSAKTQCLNPVAEVGVGDP